MKKPVIFFSLLFLHLFSYSQTLPNIFPSSGNVGIGTTSPSTNLQIGDGTGTLHYGTNGFLMKFTTGDRALMELHDPSGQNRFLIQSLANAAYLSSFDQKPLLLQGGMGNVGIGDFAPPLSGPPSNRLTVKTTVADDGIGIFMNGSTAATLRLYHGFPSYGMWSIKAYGVSNAEGGNNFGIYDENAALNRLFIKGSNGNVGIGNINPTAHLHISTPSADNTGFQVDHNYTSPNGYAALINVKNDGTKALAIQNVSTNVDGVTVFQIFGNGVVNAKSLYAEAITVTPTAIGITWPDYVFQKDYKLMPLNELEKFINAHKHLPNVPSVNDVKKDGVNLYEINKALLEKVEELSLYVIELKKEIDTLKKN